MKSIRFSVTPSPTWDEFTTVHLSARAGGDSDIGGAVASVGQDVTVEAARKYALDIIAVCNIVERSS